MIDTNLFIAAGSIVLTAYIKEMNAQKVDKQVIKNRIQEVYLLLKDVEALIEQE